MTTGPFLQLISWIGLRPDLSARLLEIIISMNRNRILCRLRSRHAKSQSNIKKMKLKKGPILPQVVQLTRQKPPVTHQSYFTQEADDLDKYSNSLESLKPADAASEPGVRTIIDIVQVVHRLWLNPDFGALLPSGMLRSTLAKLGRYVSAASFLVGEAKRQSIPATLKVEIVSCEPLPRTTYVSSPEDLQSVLSKVASPVNNSNLYQAMNLSADTESVIINRYDEIVNAKCAVHAEMQLLFHYEFLNPYLPPRVICSTKKACYLCNLFFLLHGRFFMPATHGRLYEKWTLPKRLRDLQGPKAETIHSVVERFLQAIVEAISNTFILPSKKAFASNESLFLRSSIWPASVTKQATSCPSAEHTLSAITTLATHDPIQSYRLDRGASVTLQIASPTKPARVKTESVHFTFFSPPSGPDSAASIKESYTTVEYLGADLRLQPPHQSSSIANVDIATLAPGVDVVLDQGIEDSVTRGFHVSYGDHVFFVRCWNGHGENNGPDQKCPESRSVSIEQAALFG